jgi:serine/threonine protein kinase
MASTSVLEKTLSGLKLRENEVWSVLTDCCETLQWMNELSISHLNIKPGNILKCGDRYKLADPFGSAEMLEKIMGLEDGKEKLRMYFSYAAPEIL